MRPSPWALDRSQQPQTPPTGCWFSRWSLEVVLEDCGCIGAHRNPIIWSHCGGTRFTFLIVSGRVCSLCREIQLHSVIFVAQPLRQRRRQAGSHRHRRAGITGVSPLSDHKQKRRWLQPKSTCVILAETQSEADVLSSLSGLFVVFYESLNNPGGQMHDSF